MNTVASLPAKLLACADEVESHPHPSHCEHLHVAYKLMREAAAALAAPAPSAGVGVERHAREILADEYRSAGFTGAVADALSDDPSPHCKVTLKAIERALQHPAAPSVPDLDAVVSRFLCWRLPDDFAPDNGISFTPISNPAWTHDTWPTGTNLLHAGQAKAMFAYCMEGAAPSVSPAVEGDAGELPELRNMVRAMAAKVHVIDRLARVDSIIEYARRLATPEQPGSAVQGEVEPVAWLYSDTKGEQRLSLRRWHPYTVEPAGVTETPLYTTPPPAPAAEQGLNLPDTLEQFVAEQRTAPSLPMESMLDDCQPEARGVEGMVLEAMVNRFLTWPLPDSVSPDRATNDPNRLSGKYRTLTGTNLLTASEAKAMLLHVLASAPAAPGAAVDWNMALHWIERYASGMDEALQLDRVADALGLPDPTDTAHKAQEESDGK